MMRYVAFGWIILIMVLLVACGSFLFSIGCPYMGGICIILTIMGFFAGVELRRDE